MGHIKINIKLADVNLSLSVIILSANILSIRIKKGKDWQNGLKTMIKICCYKIYIPDSKIQIGGK